MEDRTPPAEQADAPFDAARLAALERTRKRRTRRLAAAAAAIALVAAALIAGLSQCSALQDGGMEPNVIVGTMEGYTDEEIAAMLADKVDEGMIAFSLNTEIILDGPDDEAKVKFQNPPNNAKLTKLRIVRDDDGSTVYETGYVAPGTYVDAARLDAKLDPGTYACTARITSYREDDRKYLGEAACALTVTVGR